MKQNRKMKHLFPNAPRIRTDDENACNGLETCSYDGVCVAGTAPDCEDDLNPSTPNSCEPASGCIWDRGVWVDEDSGLTWQNNTDVPFSALSGAEEAKIYCQDLTLDGGGWHLPTIGELRTLVHGCPAMETSGSCPITDSCTASGSCGWTIEACSCPNEQSPRWPEDGCFLPIMFVCSIYISSTPVSDQEDWRTWSLYADAVAPGRGGGSVVCVK